MKRLSIFVLLFLNGCVSLPHPEGFVYRKIVQTPFSIASFSRITSPFAPIRFYIEGDGFAWRTPYSPSLDPTPRREMFIRLVQADVYPNVVYLARPCQYVYSDACDVYYWTAGRFDEKNVSSMEKAISTLMAENKSGTAELVGYSGGGAMALLIAARNPFVTRVYTVAGVTDHAAWTAYHGDTPLRGSLNPANYHDRLSKIPQIHYVGAKDTVVPESVTAGFVASFGSGDNIRMVVVPDASHTKGWETVWPKLINPVAGTGK